MACACPARSHPCPPFALASPQHLVCRPPAPHPLRATARWPASPLPHAHAPPPHARVPAGGLLRPARRQPPRLQLAAGGPRVCGPRGRAQRCARRCVGRCRGCRCCCLMLPLPLLQAARPHACRCGALPGLSVRIVFCCRSRCCMLRACMLAGVGRCWGCPVHRPATPAGMQPRSIKQRQQNTSLADARQGGGQALRVLVLAALAVVSTTACWPKCAW